MFSLTAWLDKIPFWRDLPYPTKGALLRAIKAGLSVTVGILVAAATGGILFPTEWNPLIVLAVTSVLQAFDKYLRESKNAEEVVDTPTADANDLPQP